MTDRETFAPLVFFEYDHKPGHYCLMLSDDHMLATEAVFTEFGYDGGGYGWAGVARSAVTMRAPELAERVGYDPEAGMFVAYGEDAEALRRLGVLLQEAHRDSVVLTGFIAAGDPGWFD
ncbi:immunity 51 family protein [Nocardia sp. alder85J]|uniref:immunity 51 family protein n=1 Tax=Nocardia sp. alder85J TaxID=2862949 RepID=UPI001CD3E445|nr:immunity 51 family protein [Nocardia sp. alder85J]MCX4094744.1 immunity 51 family protein [Nocardia sp. alder85J]